MRQLIKKLDEFINASDDLDEQMNKSVNELYIGITLDSEIL